MIKLTKQLSTTNESNPTTWFVGRHKGSIDWIKTQDITIDRFVEHIDSNNYPTAGDIVIGTLPIHMVATLNAAGVRFIHLELILPSTARGVELDREVIEQSKPQLKEYLVWGINHSKATYD